MTRQESFLEACRSAVPIVSNAEIGRRAGLKKGAVSAPEFNVPRALETRNEAAEQHGHPALGFARRPWVTGILLRTVLGVFLDRKCRQSRCNGLRSNRGGWWLFEWDPTHRRPTGPLESGF